MYEGAWNGCFHPLQVGFKLVRIYRDCGVLQSRFHPLQVGFKFMIQDREMEPLIPVSIPYR